MNTPPVADTVPLVMLRLPPVGLVSCVAVKLPPPTLMLAPLVFWTPLPEAYANGTLVGGLVIALSVLIRARTG